jgi:hypothetical protein
MDSTIKELRPDGGSAVGNSAGVEDEMIEVADASAWPEFNNVWG